MDALLLALATHGSVARRRHLLAAGFTDADLMQAYARGLVTRPHRGLYALPDAPRSALWARTMSAQLTCVSALHHVGLPALERPDALHLAIHEHRGLVEGDRRLHPGIRLHRVAHAQDTALCAPIGHILDHLGMCASDMAQLVAVDAAWNQGLITADAVDGFTATPTRRRVWLRRFADGASQSPAESIARVDLVRSGLPVVAQRVFPGIGRVDLDVADRVVGECDVVGDVMRALAAPPPDFQG